MVGRRCVFTHQAAARFCVKWRHGRHLEIVTSNQNSDSVKIIPTEFHPDPTWNVGALSFLIRLPLQEEEEDDDGDDDE